MNKGSYLLLIYLPSDQEIKIGKLGSFLFKKGYYVYVGSAMNSLTERVRRHFEKEKRYHWHIDFLLEYSEIKLAILIPSDKRLECKIAKILKGGILIKKFGSTDCTCASHLFYYQNLQKALQDIFMVLLELFQTQDQCL